MGHDWRNGRPTDMDRVIQQSRIFSVAGSSLLLIGIVLSVALPALWPLVVALCLDIPLFLWQASLLPDDKD